jgi:hypothetical protein
MYDESPFMVGFSEADNIVAISLKCRIRCSNTENSHLRTANVLQGWYSTQDQDLITTNSNHLPLTTTEGV